MNIQRKNWVLPRRTLLRGAFASLPLPFLDAMIKPTYGQARDAELPVRRFVSLYMGFGMYAPTFYPDEEGAGFTATRMLKHLDPYRQDYTVMHGLSHTQVRGGHGATASILTGTNPTSMGGRNTISIDQEIAETLGQHTRFDSFVMTAGDKGNSVSWSRSTTSIPATPARELFEQMFGKTDAVSPVARKRAYDLNKSILDDLLEQSGRMKQRLGASDRSKLDEYLDSVRGVEKQIDKQEKWANTPMPKNPGFEFTEPEDVLDAHKIAMNIIKLAFMTDSTRVVSLTPSGTQNSVFPRIGTSNPWHGLSHHSKDPEKLEQLGKIEEEQMRNYAYLFKLLKETEEHGRSLLDNSIVLITDALHDGNHSNIDLPVIVAGHGGGKVNHGNFWKYPSTRTPLTNLYVSIAQQMGVEIDRFGPDSTGRLDKIQLQTS